MAKKPEPRNQRPDRHAAVRTLSLKLKRFLRDLAVSFFRLIGSEVFDSRTGRRLGRGLIVPWRGRIHLLGFHHAFVPVLQPQPRLTYWHQEIAFTAHDEVDFPRTRKKSQQPSPPCVLLLLLDHRSPEAVAQTLALWHAAGFVAADILLAYGGTDSDFAAISHPHKFHLTGHGHLTRHHQREKQSYRELFSHAAEWLRDNPHTHVLFHEYDHLPLVKNLPARLLDLAGREDADLLGVELYRIDTTTHPHWLANETHPYAAPVTLSMLGTGHFWTREAWEAVALDHTLADWYLELDMPTTAHRLGFRARRIADQGRFVKALEKHRPTLDAALSSGAWTLHPVKDTAAFPQIHAHLTAQAIYSPLQ
jgi:hypothetical protein